MPALPAKRFFLLLVAPLATLGYFAGASVSLSDLVNNLLAYALAREYDPSSPHYPCCFCPGGCTGEEGR
jgi:hypothetical protein